MSTFIQKVTNKVSLAGLAIMGSALVVDFFGATHVAVAGAVVAILGYVYVTVDPTDVGPGSPAVA